MKSYITACPRNCYSTCSFKVWTEEGRVVKIDPDPTNPAIPNGPCLKGLSYIERTHSPYRIIHPLKRENGVFQRISWEEALSEISSRLEYFKAQFGPQSILFYASSGMSGLLNSVSLNFWKMFGGATRVFGNLCWPAGLEATRITLGENKHNIPVDLENARLIIIWGKNPAECNIHQMIPIEKAQRKGAKLIVIDPRRTPSSETADYLIQPKPGTDGILALAIAKIIIENNHHNHDFIEKSVLGFGLFKKSLRSLDLDYAAKECGVKLDFIQEIAKLAGTIKPMTLIAGYGMQRYSNGGQTIRCLLTIPVITGNIGVSGGGWQYADLQSYIFDSEKEPDSYYPSPEKDQPFRRILPTSDLGQSMLNISQPALKMAWVERGNPLSQNPDSLLVQKAFRRLEYRVVVEQFMTDTAKEADIILPAKSMFEQSDIIGSYWNPYVFLKQKVIDPPGEVKPETEIYRLLALKLGFNKTEIKKQIPENKDEIIEEWLENKLKKFPELSLERLKKGPVPVPGIQKIAFSDLKFKTPSGKIELLSEKASKQWGTSSLPGYTALSRKESFQYPLYLLSPNTKNRIHSQFGNLKVIKILEPEPYVTISYKDAKQKNIKNGDFIIIFNEKGEIRLKAKIDLSLRPGCVIIYNGYWNYNEGGPNILSKGLETDIGHGTAFHDTRVNIKKA